MTKRTTRTPLRTAMYATALTLAGGFGYAAAQTPAATEPSDVLSLGEIETRLTAEGVRIREVDIKDRVVEIEGYDANGRQVELVLDRRTGETLSKKFDD